MRFAAAEVDEEILGEEARGDHPRAVGDEPLREKLPRRGVDDRVARAAFDPRGPACLVVLPREVLPVGTERLRQELRSRPQHLVGELAPDELFPERDRVRRVPHRAHGDRAELQILGEPARSIEIEPVAILAVPIVAERIEARRRSALSGFEKVRVADDAEVFARRDRSLVRNARSRTQSRRGNRVADPGMRDQRVPERREHFVRAARRGADRSRGNESLALEEIERHVERLGYAAITFPRERLRPTVCDDAIDRELARYARHDVDAPALHDEEARPESL